MGRGRVSYTRRPSRHAANSGLDSIEEEGRRTPTQSPGLSGNSPATRRRALSSSSSNSNSTASAGKKSSHRSPATTAAAAASKAQRILTWMTQRLGASFKVYLAGKGGSIPFDREGLGNFFEESPESKKIVDSYPGVLGSMLANAGGIEVVVGAAGRSITLTQ